MTSPAGAFPFVSMGKSTSTETTVSPVCSSSRAASAWVSRFSFASPFPVPAHPVMDTNIKRIKPKAANLFACIAESLPSILSRRPAARFGFCVQRARGAFGPLLFAPAYLFSRRAHQRIKPTNLYLYYNQNEMLLSMLLCEIAQFVLKYCVYFVRLRGRGRAGGGEAQLSPSSIFMVR